MGKYIVYVKFIKLGYRFFYIIFEMFIFEKEKEFVIGRIRWRIDVGNVLFGFGYDVLIIHCLCSFVFISFFFVMVIILIF